MKKLNLKKVAFSALTVGFVLGAPSASYAAGDTSKKYNQPNQANDNTDEDDEQDEIFAAAGCGTHGCAHSGNTSPSVPTTPVAPDSGEYPRGDQPDVKPVVPQYQQTPTRQGHGCGGIAMKSSGVVESSKRSSLI